MAANYTENFNLKKPAQTDNYNIDDANGNMDLIDATLKKHSAQLNANAQDIKNINDTLITCENDNILAYRTTALTLENDTGIAIEWLGVTPESSKKMLQGDNTNFILEPGLYIINVKLTFQANSSGFRQLRLVNGDNWILSMDVQSGIDGYDNRLEVTRILKVTSPTKIKVVAYQKSGSALTIYGGDNSASISIGRIN
ncbi:hypothetical protein [Clostridium sp. BJN0001]|uniref:hypothetical protein n=1 Tax=Clostridium sp. BJN0001 TaxID=2930219 RepID=UPI001FD11BED|nr:hypothetical protein [Clostridium sp. BJN0001]